MLIRKRRFWKLAVLCTCGLLLMHFYFQNKKRNFKFVQDYPPQIDLHEFERLNTTEEPTTTTEELPVYGRNISTEVALFKLTNRRLILVWRHPWGVETEGVREGYKVDNCVFTYDKERIAEASAVIFHYSALDNEKIPWRHYRHPDQRYVFETLESPNYMTHAEHRSLKEYDGGFINWTMSYHTKADVFAPYFTNKDDLTMHAQGVVDNLMKMKSRLVLWVVSNCGLLYGSVERMKYAQALADAGLDVSYYGKCFNNSVEYNNFNRTQHAQFKFYLSFENAVHCKDYVTEKFWQSGINYGRVPIVFGPSKADMEKLAPRNSYIHTEDFKSPKHLVAYLQWLDGNDVEYRRYFDWRLNPDHETQLKLSMYSEIREKKLCRMLGNGLLMRKSYPSMSQYVYGEQPDECLRAKPVPATTTVLEANKTSTKPEQTFV